MPSLGLAWNFDHACYSASYLFLPGAVTSPESGCYVSSSHFPLNWITLWSNILSFGENLFFRWLLHILHMHPYHDSAPSNHSIGSSWRMVGKQKSGNYCCWIQYFLGCWPKANSWPLLTNTEVSLSPSHVPEEFKHFGDFNCSIFLWQQLCGGDKQPFILFSLSSPVNRLYEWTQGCKSYNIHSQYLLQNILTLLLMEVAYHLGGAHLKIISKFVFFLISHVQ